jgi:tetratricopeptide (TPR) repeat protein
MENAKHALTVLNRLAHRRPEQRRQLELALRGRLERLGLIAVEVAIETGDPIGDVLADVLREGADLNLLERLQALLPKDTTALRETAVEVARQRLEVHLRSGEFNTPEIAFLYHLLAIRLAATGHTEEALEASANELFLLHKWAEILPAEFTKYYSRALANYSNRLTACGRFSEASEVALEALEIERSLCADGDFDLSDDLARSLMVSAIALSRHGTQAEALKLAKECVKIFRTLFMSDTRFRADLAGALRNVAIFHSECDQRREALTAVQEAAQLLGAVVDSRSDALIPDFAGVLLTEANALRRMGSQDAALSKYEQAADLIRTLIRHQPRAFHSEFFAVLVPLASLQDQLGHVQEAMDVCHELVLHCRALAQEYGGDYYIELEKTLVFLRLIARNKGLLSESGAADAELAELRNLLSSVGGNP